MNQLSIFEAKALVPEIDRRFLEFHSNNPEIYSELVSLARKMRSTGRQKYGLKALFEVLRWNRNLKTIGDDFRLNNNYTSLYSRLIMAMESDLDGFFETRQRRAV